MTPRILQQPECFQQGTVSKFSIVLLFCFLPIGENQLEFVHLSQDLQVKIFFLVAQVVNLSIPLSAMCHLSPADSAHFSGLMESENRI